MYETVVRVFRLMSLAVLGVFSAYGEEAVYGEEVGVEDLLAVARSEPDIFQKVYAEAFASGVSEADLALISTLNMLSNSDIDGLLEVLPRLEAAEEQVDPTMGGAFYSKRQLGGFLSTLRAVKAYQANDYEGFENHALKSVVNAPDFANAFGLLKIMSRLRAEEAKLESMANLRVPMDLVVANVEGEERSLEEWMGDRKAMLFDFWASWCGPCIQMMPELRAKAELLPAQGVFVAGMNTDQGNQLEKANKVRSQRNMESVPWLLEPKSSPLSSLLMIDSIPRMILVDASGAVLFNGHPMDEKLKSALAKLGVALGE